MTIERMEIMDPTKASPNNIDQIRQLIFGEQIQDYDRRFQELQKKLDQLNKSLQAGKEETDEKLKEIQKTFQKDLASKIDAVKQEILEVKKSLSNLNDDKVDRNQLADQLIDLAMRLKGSSILDQIDKGITADGQK
jgi:vacuolar-type H+-ATPase subunit I/STV1